MERTLEVSVEGLAQRLEADQSVFIAGSSGEPVELTELLVRDPGLARRVRFITSFVPGINRRNLVVPGSERRMRVFFNDAILAGTAAGAIEFLPLTYSGVRQHLADPATPLDTLVIQVAKPDADGRCSLGPAVEFMPELLRRKVRLLAIVNDNVPDLPGSPRVALDAFECFARSRAPLATYDAGSNNEASERIAAHLLGLLPSGCTLQIGLGKVPANLLRALAVRRDLALHSGMLSDSVMALADAGALRREAPLTTTVAMGSAAFYQRLAGLSGLRLAGVEHTHDASIIAGIPRFFAINSAIEVDLLGQANAEAIGRRYVSGPGGLPDFAHAARRSPGGLSVIALNSTDGSGRQSKIVAAISPGAPVTVPQHDVDVVVTEWGVADLRGRTVEERARRLIAVAHPDHRKALHVHTVN